MTKRFWGCALMTLLSAGVSAGFSLAGLLGSGSGDSFACYATSRSVALLVTVLIAIGVRSRTAIAFLGIAMTSVQAFDGVIGAFARAGPQLPRPSGTQTRIQEKKSGPATGRPISPGAAPKEGRARSHLSGGCKPLHSKLGQQARPRPHLTCPIFWILRLA